VGLQHELVSDATFSATILMTLVTTLAAPLLLKWSYRERPSRVASRSIEQPAPGLPLHGARAVADPLEI
jgi:hypothetical protein